MINSPGNPSGRVLNRRDLEMIAGLCEEYDAWLISDEVYEHLCYDGREHIKALFIPALRERAICVSSFGKAFGLTGWRLGHVLAAPPLAWAVHLAHQQMSFCTPRALQVAATEAWQDADDVLDERRRDAEARRDQLCDGLRALGMTVGVPDGGYFCTLDIRPLGFDDDIVFAETVVAEAGVAVAPMSPSWVGRRDGRHVVRLCFAKCESTIRAFLERFGAWSASKLRA